MWRKKWQPDLLKHNGQSLRDSAKFISARSKLWPQNQEITHIFSMYVSEKERLVRDKSERERSWVDHPCVDSISIQCGLSRKLASVRVGNLIYDTSQRWMTDHPEWFLWVINFIIKISFHCLLDVFKLKY